MKIIEEVRVDKFLWAVRLYKTRSIATEACKKGHISLNGHSVKPSAKVNNGQEIQVKKNNIYYKYRIKQLLDKRVGAKFVDNYIEDITPTKELEKLELDTYARNLYRQKGTGRPTKKERRDLDRLWEDSDD